MEALDELGKKINVLLRKYLALQAENESLQQLVTLQNGRIDSLTRQLEEAKTRLLAEEVARSLPDAATREQVRKQLDHVLREIDNVLTNLND